MTNEVITRTVREWDNMTDAVLELKEFSLSDMQKLLSATYSILYRYHKDSLIPKEITALFVSIYDFLYFASLMEENEKTVDFYNYQGISFIVHVLQTGFLGGNYELAYPRIKIKDISKNSYILDLEKDSLESFFKEL